MDPHFRRLWTEWQKYSKWTKWTLFILLDRWSVWQCDRSTVGSNQSWTFLHQQATLAPRQNILQNLKRLGVIQLLKELEDFIILSRKPSIQISRSDNTIWGKSSGTEERAQTVFLRKCGCWVRGALIWRKVNGKPNLITLEGEATHQLQGKRYKSSVDGRWSMINCISLLCFYQLILFSPVFHR